MKKKLYFLKDVLKYCKTQKDSFLTIRDLASVYDISDPKKKDSVFQVAFDFAKNCKGIDNDVRSLHTNYGAHLLKSGRFAKASDYFESALAFENTAYSRLTIISNLVYALISLDNWTRAEEYILEAVSITEKNNFQARKTNTAVHYAQLLIRQGKEGKAEEELKNSIEYLRETGNISHLSYSLNTWMNLLIKQSRWKEYKTALKELKEITANRSASIRSRYYSKALNLFNHEKRYDELLVATDSLYRLSQLTHLAVQSHRAMKYKSIALSGLGKKSAAYQSLLQAEVLADSVFRSDQANYVAGMEARFKRKEQDSKIILLDEKNQSQEKLLSQQRSMILGGGIALFLISILSFLLYRYSQQINTQKHIIFEALDQKDILLREIHHRVKNNLQLVSSLLTLQGRSITDEAALQAITDGKARVRSMALIHQDLYNKENLTGVDVPEYLKKLTKELVKTYALDASKVDLKMNVEVLQLDVDTIVPLGLIINELLTNSLKYAFPDGRDGTIEMDLVERDGQLILRVQDDGIGVADNIKKDNSFGTTLISSLCRQLKGQMEISTPNQGGMRTSLSFMDYNKTKL